MQFFSRKGENKLKNEPIFPSSECFWGRRAAASGPPAVSQRCGDGHCHIYGAVTGAGGHPMAPPPKDLPVRGERKSRTPPKNGEYPRLGGCAPSPGSAVQGQHPPLTGGGEFGVQGGGKLGCKDTNPNPAEFPSRLSFFPSFCRFPTAQARRVWTIPPFRGRSASPPLYFPFSYPPMPPLFFFFLIYLECKASG